jgi:murein tripeptide amidase MpaA
VLLHITQQLHSKSVPFVRHENDVFFLCIVPNAGESMAEWFAEGLLERLTAEGAAAAGGDAEVAQLLHSAVLFIVPNMCPDGSVR